MKRERNRIFRLIVFYVTIAILLAIFMPREVNWSPSFSKHHNTPYGNEALYENLSSLFETEQIKVVDEPLYNFASDTTILRTNYIIINSDLYLDSLDLSSLYKVAESGNNVFVSAETFNREFLDSLGLGFETKFASVSNLEELNAQKSKLQLVNSDSSYTFKMHWSNNYFVGIDTIPTRASAIGKQDTLTNFIKVPYGKGFFFLHSFPYALTNYYLMQEKQQDYIAAVFSQLDKEYNVIWDEYYKPHRSYIKKSPLSVIMQFASFRWAYWLIISGVFLYLIFFAKRRQKAIPIMVPPRNENLQFVRTLGSLYYNKGSHRDIINKKIKVFKEYISSNYHIRDLQFTDKEAEILSLKSGRNRTLIDGIFNMIHELQNASEIGDGQVKALVRKINEFYNYQ